MSATNAKNDLNVIPRLDHFGHRDWVQQFSTITKTACTLMYQDLGFGGGARTWQDREGKTKAQKTSRH